MPVRLPDLRTQGTPQTTDSSEQRRPTGERRRHRPKQVSCSRCVVPQISVNWVDEAEIVSCEDGEYAADSDVGISDEVVSIHHATVSPFLLFERIAD